MRKWESRLSELKTTREYAALARELDIAKKTNEGAEEEIRRLAGEYEEIRKGLAPGDMISRRDLGGERGGKGAGR